MASIRQRASGYWQAIVRRKGYPDESRTFATKTEAQDWAQSVETDMRRGQFENIAESQRITLSDLISDFKNDFAPHHYRKRADQKESWRFQLERLKEAIGDYSLAAIDQKVVAAYRDARLKGSASRPAVKESTVRKELYMLSKVLGFAQAEKGIALPRGNPVDKIRKPVEGRGRDRRLSPDEWATFERECKKSRNPWLWPGVQLAVETAVRQGELLSMTWKQIDKKNMIAMLDDPDKTKNGEVRAVPLSPSALAVLGALPRSTSGLVLPVERMTLYHAFRYACERAKINDFTWHDLRHEALSRLAERGDFDVIEMAEVSGHKTLQMLKRYTHLRAGRLAEKLARKPG